MVFTLIKEKGGFSLYGNSDLIGTHCLYVVKLTAEFPIYKQKVIFSPIFDIGKGVFLENIIKDINTLGLVPQMSQKKIQTLQDHLNHTYSRAFSLGRLTLIPP